MAALFVVLDYELFRMPELLIFAAGHCASATPKRTKATANYSQHLVKHVLYGYVFEVLLVRTR